MTKKFKNCLELALQLGFSNEGGLLDKIEMIVRWIKPSNPYVKVNYDGYVGAFFLGVGGIIRNLFGGAIATYASLLNPCKVITTKLLGLCQGLDIYYRMGIINV